MWVIYLTNCCQVLVAVQNTISMIVEYTSFTYIIALLATSIIIVKNDGFVISQSNENI